MKIPYKQLNLTSSLVPGDSGGEYLLRDGSVALTGTFDANSNLISNLATPVADTDAAPKGYVDSVAEGLSPKEAVRLATAAALPAYTQAGAGVGATLTAVAVGALTVDGVLVVDGDRVLVKNGATNDDNGIYDATEAGDGATAFILTRAQDFDAAADVIGGHCFVLEGTANADTSWVCTADAPITMDTTLLPFVQFSGVGTYLGGDGIDITGMTISVDLSATPGLEFSAGLLRILLPADGSLALAAGGLVASVPSVADVARAPGATAGDNADTTLDITATPAKDSLVVVQVNGIGAEIGNGVKTKDCYFSVDAGVSARALTAIAAGDSLYWNGVIAGFNLAATDLVDMLYEAAV